MNARDLIEAVVAGARPRDVVQEALDPSVRKKLIMAIYNAQPGGNKLLRAGKHQIMYTGSWASHLGKETYSSDTLEDLSDEELLRVAKAAEPLAQSLKAYIAQAKASGFTEQAPGMPEDRVWPKDLPNDKPTWTHDQVGQRLLVTFHHGADSYRIQSSAQDRSHPGAEDAKIVFAMRDALMKMLNGQSHALVKVSHDLWQLP